MFKRSIIVFVLSFILAFSFKINAQENKSLPRSTPEAEGVSSQAILDFINAVDSGKHEYHSIMILRHGKVITEGWWKPYKPELKHTLYSLSKSFTSTAVGFAVSEKILTVDDKVIKYFPNDLPDTVSAYLKELSIKDLLTMTAGQDPILAPSARKWNYNWIKKFLATPIKDKPGTKFLYNSMATYMLSAIIQKVTGKKLLDYIKPRLFEPLGITDADWETSPDNVSMGGWGLRLKTEDLAKFGQFYLQKGKWEGKQILPKEWIEEATTIKILQSPEKSQAERDSSDWLQGYGYKFWKCRHGAFRGDGAYGQYIIVMPEQDAVIVITEESYDLQGELNLVWKYLLPGFVKQKPSGDEKTYSVLTEKLNSLALAIPSNTNKENIASKITNRRFTLDANQKRIENISFGFVDEECRVTLKEDSVKYDLGYGDGKWVEGETMRRGPYMSGTAKFSMIGLPPSRVAGSYIWKDKTTLELTLRYIESPHTEKLICRFDENKITIEITNSVDPEAPPIIINGSCL